MNKKHLKHLVTMVMMLVISFNLSSCTDVYDENLVLDVSTPYSVADCKGKDKEAVRDDFVLAGFSNVFEETINDLDITESNMYGTVESVSINGVTNFEGNEEFKSLSRVVIKYHSYKLTSVPFSYEEVEDIENETIIEAFRDAGFVTITSDEVYDIDPDIGDKEFINNVSIDGITYFEKDEQFPANAEVKIVVHRPYKKHTLKVLVDFVPNLIFNIYDVYFEIDGNTERLAHGNDAEFEYRLKEGEYTLVFESAETSSVKTETEINLTGDTEVSYKISCHSDSVSVDTKYVENKGAVGENEAMVPSSASNCKYEDYHDVEKAFKAAGFTNIKTEVLYDIVFGWTVEGEVEKVSIDGKTDFNRGDVFAKDTAIIITYHMREEDDPNKKIETTFDTSLPEKASPVFYSTNDYKTAINGDSGVFSYKNKNGSYDIYWIVDFDEGYVYFFTDGNGDTTCDKVKIVSGHLNDRITVTWHDGGEQWSWYLHFKYVNSPVTLVVNDHNGFVTEFSATDLYDAIAIRDAKNIKEY